MEDDYWKRLTIFLANLLGFGLLTAGSVLYLMEMANALPTWVPQTPTTHWLLAVPPCGLMLVAMGVLWGHVRERALGPE